MAHAKHWWYKLMHWYMTWGTNYSICLGCSLLKLCSKSLQHVHPYGSCCSSCTPPTRTHAFARCSTGFTRKRVSCSNSDNEIIWTLGSPGQLVPLFAHRRCIKIRVKIQNSVNSTFPDIIEQLHGNSYRPSFIPHNCSHQSRFWIKCIRNIEALLNAADLCYHTLLVRWSTISFKKHGTACTGLLLQPRNSTHTHIGHRVVLFFVMQVANIYEKYSSPMRPKQSIKIWKTFFDPSEALHPGLSKLPMRQDSKIPPKWLRVGYWWPPVWSVWQIDKAFHSPCTERV